MSDVTRGSSEEVGARGSDKRGKRKDRGGGGPTTTDYDQVRSTTTNYDDRKWDTKSNSSRSGGWATVTGTLTRPLGELRFESGVPGGSEAAPNGEEVV